MKNLTRRFLCGLVLVFWNSFSVAAFLFAALSPRPESARPFGMGNAFVAVANDVNTIFFNPAGLGTIKQIELSALAGRSVSYDAPPQNEVNVAGTLPLQVYKASWDYGVLGCMAHRTGRQGDNHSTNIGVSWGGNPNQIIPGRVGEIPYIENLLTGFSLRVREVQRAGLTSSSDMGVSCDFGLLYRFGDSENKMRNGWSAGLAVQEMNTKSIGSGVLYRFGAAWRSPNSILAMDMALEDGVAKFFPGAEVAMFRRLLLLRLGSGYIPGEPRQFVLGIGTVLPPVQIDFSYGFPTGETSKSNDRILLSFTYRFGIPFLSQYIYQDRVEKITEIENDVANMETKKETLSSKIREQRELYETMVSDSERMRSKAKKAENEYKEKDDELASRRREIEGLEEEIKNLKTKKVKAEAKMREDEKEKAERIEVRPPGSPGGIRKHKVVAGDSLRDLAQKYYGDPNKWQFIYQANEEKIIRGVPKEGEILKIP